MGITILIVIDMQNLIYHLVVVTKFRKKCINNKIYNDLNVHFKRLLEGKGCKLLEFGGKKDHIHIMFSTPPQVQLSKVVNHLKTSISRLIERDYDNYLKSFILKNIFGQEVIVLYLRVVLAFMWLKNI